MHQLAPSGIKPKKFSARSRYPFPYSKPVPAILGRQHGFSRRHDRQALLAGFLPGHQERDGA
jgi:hypothetical protein